MTLAGGTAAFNPSASNNGILLRLRGVQLHQTAVWLNREGMRLGDLGVVEGYASVLLSPNAARLVTIDLARGTTTKLAQRVKPEGTAVWAPDGASVVFTARDKNGVQRMYRADASNTRPESVLLDEPGLHWPNDWSRDGRFLLYGFDEGKSSNDLWVLPMDQPNAKPFQYTHRNTTIRQAHFSPNGRFVAYTSDESGRYEIIVQPFPDASKGKWVISQAGGVEPQWSKDGRELFFFSGQRMMAVDITVLTANPFLRHGRSLPGSGDQLGTAIEGMPASGRPLTACWSEGLHANRGFMRYVLVCQIVDEVVHRDAVSKAGPLL